MTKDGLPGEASQEGQSRPVSLAGLVLVLCVALMGVMGVSITLPILPKLGAVFHQDAAGVALLITCFTLPSAFMTPVAGVLADRFGRKAVLLPGLLLFALQRHEDDRRPRVDVRKVQRHSQTVGTAVVAGH